MRLQPMYVGNLFVVVDPLDRARLVEAARWRGFEIVFPSDPEFWRREQYGRGARHAD